MTEENITFLIAVAGFVMSLSNWIHTWVTQKKNIALHPVKLEMFSKTINFYLMLENKSRLPISVTRIALIHEGETVECEVLPVLVSEQGSFEEGRFEVNKSNYSTPLPVHLGSLGASTCLLRFEDVAHMPQGVPTQLTLLICTNRGKSKTYSLSLNKAEIVRRSRW